MAVRRLAFAAALTSSVFAAKAKCKPAASYDGSPFEGVQLRPDPYYLNELQTLAIPQLPEELVPAAEQLTEISTFQWL